MNWMDTLQLRAEQLIARILLIAIHRMTTAQNRFFLEVHDMLVKSTPLALSLYADRHGHRLETLVCSRQAGFSFLCYEESSNIPVSQLYRSHLQIESLYIFVIEREMSLTESGTCHFESSFRLQASSSLAMLMDVQGCEPSRLWNSSQH